MIDTFTGGHAHRASSCPQLPSQRVVHHHHHHHHRGVWLVHGLNYRSRSGCWVQPSSLATTCALCLLHTNNNLPVYVTFQPLAYSASMIRDGKLHGWLSLPVHTLPAWASLNDVSFDGVAIGPLPGKEDRGSTVIAKRHLKGGHEPPLMTIPRDLILSLERIHQHAKSDSDFRAVLDGLDEFGRVGNSAYLFLRFTSNLSST